MGGNALAKFGAERKTKAEYEQLKKEIFAKLKVHYPEPYGFKEILSYTDKTSFGDLDILYTNGFIGMKDELKLIFPGPCYSNDNALSILYKGLQVDLIHM